MGIVKRWAMAATDPERPEALFRELKVHPALCRILVQRGIYTYEKAKAYFRPSLDQLHDPFLMKDMQQAVNRVLKALDSKEKILVFGDYDVDGTTSVACMYRFLKQFHAHTEFYIPHRYR